MTKGEVNQLFLGYWICYSLLLIERVYMIQLSNLKLGE